MANTVEPTRYAFTSNGVFGSWDGGNSYVVNTSLVVNTFTGTWTMMTSDTMVSGHVIPFSNAYNLGNTTLRWGTVYVSDVSLNNGVGDWTIVEGEDDLFLYNNKRSKVYKFNLTEIDPADATPKRK